MDERMHEDLVPLVLAAARELDECAASGEHPAAATSAVEAAYFKVSGLRWVGRADAADRWYWLLLSVFQGCAAAGRLYECDREAAACKVRLERRRLRDLVRAAERAREAELCGFGA